MRKAITRRDIIKGAAALGVTPVAWYDSDTPLRSGWAWGQAYLKGSAAVVDARSNYRLVMPGLVPGIHAFLS